MLVVNKREKFHIDGYSIEDIEKDSVETFNKILDTVKSLKNNSIKDGYVWREKYTGSYDLKPDIVSYDPCFIDFLLENNIFEKLTYLTGSKWSLFHAQLRYTTDRSNKIFDRSGTICSYMDWHRDSYVRNDKIVGMIPSPIKLIIYPDIDKDSEHTVLKLVKHSHKIQINNNKQNFTEKYYHQALTDLDLQLISNEVFEKQEIKPSNEKYLMFNTALLHGATACKKEKEFRIVYTFILDEQFKDINDELHLTTKKLMDSALEKIKNSKKVS